MGIVINRNKELRERENVRKNVGKCKTILNSWLQRDITVFGRVLLSKMESLSRAIYPAFSQEISDTMIKLINNINFKFIWKNKCQYVRRDEVVKSIEEDGVNAIDFSVMNGVLKLKLLYSFILKFFKKWEALNLCCDYDIYELPVKLSHYHQQVLLYWNIYKHNFTPHNSQLCGIIDIY